VEPKNPILERFERAVDLPLYLGYRGFRLAPQDGDQSRLRMEDPKSGDTLFVTKNLDTGAWSYTNARDPKDRGTLTDYLMTREGLATNACLERIVALANPLVRDAQGHAYRQYVHSGAPELQRAVAGHLTVVEAATSALRRLDKLGVDTASLDQWRFGHVKNENDIATLVRDPSDLWASKYRSTDKKIVLTEQPIDAIAYEKSRGRQECCYMATGGSPSEAQKRRLAHVLSAVPPGTTVVLAFGRSPESQKLAAEIQALVPMVKMERETPAFTDRWSNQMQLEQRHARSMQRVAPSLSR
jgi:hypothetical protein